MADQQDPVQKPLDVHRGLWHLPDHVLGYSHAGCDAGGYSFAAPISVEALISHLAVELDKLGRVGQWNPATDQGMKITTLGTAAAQARQPCVAHDHQHACVAGNP